MKYAFLPIAGAYLIELTRSSDERGSFVRVFCAREFETIGLRKSIVQINRSFSRTRGTLRGMHYQLAPHTETKLVSCLHGSVYDVLLDLRKGSPSFLQWHAETLQEGDDQMVSVPEGVAHGFLTLADKAELLYFHTDFYSPSHEAGVRYNDPRVGIRWPQDPTEISARDAGHQLLSEDFEGIEL